MSRNASSPGPYFVNRVTRVSAPASTVNVPGKVTSSIAYGGSICDTPRSASCMIDTWGCTPSAHAYWSSLCTTIAIAGSGSAIPAPVAAYITRPRLGVSSTVAPARLPDPDIDFSATATTPPVGLVPLPTRLLQWSLVTIGTSTVALIPGETMNCCNSVGAMFGAVAESVSVVFAGTSRLNAAVLSATA